MYWVIYARDDWSVSTQRTIGDIVFWGYGAGVGGNFVAGWLIDRIGRKAHRAPASTCSAAIAIVGLFHPRACSASTSGTSRRVFCFAAANTATHVYASELFPTEIRATGYGWTTNLFGRVTEIATPIADRPLDPGARHPVGRLARVAFGPILGALFVLRYAPETRGLTLEQIQSIGAEPVRSAG